MYYNLLVYLFILLTLLLIFIKWVCSLKQLAIIFNAFNRSIFLYRINLIQSLQNLNPILFLDLSIDKPNTMNFIIKLLINLFIINLIFMLIIILIIILILANIFLFYEPIFGCGMMLLIGSIWIWLFFLQPLQDVHGGLIGCWWLQLLIKLAMHILIFSTHNRKYLYFIIQSYNHKFKYYTTKYILFLYPCINILSLCSM